MKILLDTNKGDVVLTCEFCNKSFARKRGQVLAAKKHKDSKIDGRKILRFCSNACKHKAWGTKIQLCCTECNKTVYKTKAEIRQVKKNVFCSQSCAAKYNNAHKTKGTRTSKLERWLQQILPNKYPLISFVFNEKKTINSELDIYIPSLKLAFELNGIFHYEPIYGKDKLDSIQNNDKRKFQACLEKQIELCVIDVSNLKYFKEKNAEKYLNIIQSIISMKFANRKD